MSRNQKEDTIDHEEHIELATFIKGVHAELRNKYKNRSCDLEKIWFDHCQNEAVLKRYAEAMHRLAAKHWTRNPETRIDWCRLAINDYFRKDGLRKLLEKEERRKKHLEERMEEPGQNTSNTQSRCYTGTEVNKIHTVNTIKVSNSLDPDQDRRSVGLHLGSTVCKRLLADNKIIHWHAQSFNRCLPFEEKILLIDVGSCFNPFSEFDEFHAVGIDISPATKSVFQCDFLNLVVTEPEDSSTFLSKLNSPLTSLPALSFHVVVFSLLLEYLPAPCQRWKCCQIAHKLLKLNGVLVIITPDSHQQHRNAHLMKTWKIAIESLGFKRWRYVKLEHLHCMVFTKTLQTAALASSVDYVEMLAIPQDFSNIEESSRDTVELDDSSISEEDYSSTKSLLQELPLTNSYDEEIT